MLKKRIGQLAVTLLACLPMLAGAAEPAAGAVAKMPLRLGVHAGVNRIVEVTDAPWGVYADGVGYGASLSFDARYKFLPWLYLHSEIGIDYRYFASDYMQMGFDCDCESGGNWSGKNKDYLLSLEIPVLAQAHVRDIIYFELGPVFDFLLMRKSEFYIPKEHRADKCHEDRTLGAGLSVGVGHEFSFGLFVDARLSFQLTDVVTVDKTCGSYTISWGSSRTDNESGKETVEKDGYIDESIVGSYYLFNKVQLGVGYWF